MEFSWKISTMPGCLTSKFGCHDLDRIFMENTPKYRFSEPVTTFHGSRLPERATPVGYPALIDALDLKVPMPRTLSAIGPRHKSYQQHGWHIYTPRHAPPASLEGHLTFALKYEGLDLRLQRIVIGDDRFVLLGLRNEGGFVGDRDRDSGAPLPVHISARHEDLPSLIEGLVAFDRKAAPDLDAVLAATVLAFGFIYIHPFADANGRLHRYLIHHILAECGFNPPGMAFPVSAAILDRINDYRRTLESYSARLLPFIKWEPTDKGNVRVLNETADFYRFFDATPHAEFLYECVARTIDVDLPAEARHLQAYDTFRRSVTEIVDMPEGTVDLLFRFLRQNTGVLLKRGREKEFVKLTDDEIAKVEASYRNAFPK